MYSSAENDMHVNNNNAPIAAAKNLQSPNKHTHTPASKSIIFISSPMCSYFYCACTMHTQYIYFFSFLFSWRNTKEITPLFLPRSCQNNQCFPERDLWRDMRGEKAEGCRHSSRALVVDNKWGAVLGYVLQLSRLIIFDMHSGVYTVSSVKSSPAIEGNRVQGAHNAARTHTEVLFVCRYSCLCFKSLFPFFSRCPISYPRHNWRH